MKISDLEQEEQERIVVKYSTTQNLGVESTRLTRNAIGYVLRGEKFIHDNDRFQRIGQGNIFFLGQATHYIENVAEANDTFEQIVFYFSPAILQQIIASLQLPESALTSNNTSFHTTNVATSTPSKITRNFLNGTNRHYEYGGFLHDPQSEILQLTELTYNILIHESGAVKDCLLQCLDQEKAEFERIIYSNLLSDKSVEELAAECSRSLTSFKKEFKRIFGTPPHQWYLRQRLNYAKMLLDTTRESISQIGNICAFPNTSHFIKLFKRYFGDTPAVYRTHHHNQEHSELNEMQEREMETA